MIQLFCFSDNLHFLLYGFLVTFFFGGVFSTLRNYWRRQINAEQFMHALISFGQMTRMGSRMERGAGYTFKFCSSYLRSSLNLGYSKQMLYINFFSPDDCRVLLCLKRSLRIANAAQQMANVTRGSSGPVTLFVEILNKSVVLSEFIPC